MKLTRIFLASVAVAATIALVGCPDPADTARPERELAGTVSIVPVGGGDVDVGRTLEVSITNLRGSGSVSFLWQRVPLGQPTFTDIGDWAADRTHVVTDADRGHIIRVLVRRMGYTGEVSSNQVGPIELLLGGAGGTVAVEGVPVLGMTLEAVSTLPGAGAVSYQWYSGTNPADVATFEPIDGAVFGAYVVTLDDLGRHIRVVVRRVGFGGYVEGFAAGAVPDPTGPSIAQQLSEGRTSLVLYYNEWLPPQMLSSGNITIRGGGTPHGTTLSIAGPGTLFTVGSGARLKLRDIELRGLVGDVPGEAANNNALVVVSGGGRLYMEAGSRIAWNENTSPLYALRGGGVRIATGGTLVMRDGAEITRNFAVFGGGVGMAPRANFIMEGGEIHTNIANYGGGVYIGAEAVVTLEEGVIGNNLSNRGGGVYNRGIFTMRDGEVSENVTMSFPGAPALGGGVASWAGAVFNMYGGEIVGNLAEGLGQSAGGGVLNAGNFVIRGGRVHDNIASQGGGIHNQNMFTMFGGAVSQNQANIGGGVSNVGNNTNVFTMRGGRIYGNFASWEGGGVLNVSASFLMSDGVIYGLGAGEDLANTCNVDSVLFSVQNDVIGAHMPVSRHGFFDAAGIFIPTGDFPLLGFTLRMENGQVVHPVVGLTFTGIPPRYIISTDNMGSRMHLVLVYGGEDYELRTMEVRGATMHLPIEILLREVEFRLTFLERWANVVKSEYRFPVNMDRGIINIPFGDLEVVASSLGAPESLAPLTVRHPSQPVILLESQDMESRSLRPRWHN